MIATSLSVSTALLAATRLVGSATAVAAALSAVPVVTLTKRLPTPSARPQSSVISQPIVCGPLVSVDQSKMKWPPAAYVFEKPGNAPAMSARTSP